MCCAALPAVTALCLRRLVFKVEQARVLDRLPRIWSGVGNSARRGAAQMADEAGVPSYDSLDAVATLQRSERYQTVMKVRPRWLLNLLALECDGWQHCCLDASALAMYVRVYLRVCPRSAPVWKGRRGQTLALAV